MNIKIKMRTVLNGDKGCYSEEEIRNRLYFIKEEMIKSGNINSNDEFSNNYINTVANSLQGIIPRNYDYQLNRLIAGLMGATCYMPDTFEKLNAKPNENILRIASLVENSGHHSTFGHSFLTLEISEIPKALAMVLNNENDYNTSEKSARYTRMQDVEPTQNALYNKWVEIFEKVIKEKHPNGSNAFFDENGKKARKLAQENARYMISVFTPTNMVYTTNFRQLNYICHWFEKQIAEPENNFYKQLIPSMKEFVAFCKDNNLYSNQLTDGKDRRLSLFGDPILKKDFSSSYQCAYRMSFACLAQEQRHRTISYNIDKLRFVDDFSKNTSFYIPPIIRGSKYEDEYKTDICKVAEYLPQGTLISVGERGTYESFLLKAKERLCQCAQKEIRDITAKQVQEYRVSLELDCNDDKTMANYTIYSQYIDQLKKMEKGARCKSGYKCASPCGYKEGINMESDI